MLFALQWGACLRKRRLTLLRGRLGLKRLYMHIGLPRCASTLIEHVFFEPKYEPYNRLLAAGVSPLTQLSREMRRNASTPRWRSSLCRRLREHHLLPLQNDEHRAYFISDESLTFFEDKPGAPTVFADRAMFTSRFHEGYDPHVILIVRNQVSYLESFYSLNLQNGGTQDFQTYVSQFPLDNLNWLPVANAFADAVGEKNISVIPFETKAYGKNAPYSDFFDALFRIMEVDHPMSLSEMPVANRSLDPDMIPVQLRANRELDAQSAKIVFAILCETFPKAPGKPMNLLTPEQADAVRNLFRPSNEELFKRFMPKFDSAAYFPS